MGLGPRPELADVARLAGRVLSLAVAVARGQDAPVQRALAAHLGPRAAGWPVVTASWPAYDQVNVQVGLDAWLAGPGLRHELLGLTGVRHGHVDLADLTAAGPPRSPAGVPGIGSVTAAARPAGPGGITRACVTCGLYLVDSGGQRSAVLLRGPAGDDPRETVSIQVTAAEQATAGQIADQIRALATRHNVYRGQVISLGADASGPAGGSVPGFLDRPRLDRATVILPRTCWTASSGRSWVSPGIPASSARAASTSAAASCCMGLPGPARRTPSVTWSASCRRSRRS